MMRMARWVGWVLLLALLIAGGVVAAIQDLYVLVFYASYASVGLVLVIRRPRNFLGWLLIVLAFGFITVGSSFPVDVTGLEDGTASVVDTLIVWASSWAGYLTFTGFIALAVLFPIGRLPERPWRRPAFALIAAGLILAALSAVAPTLTYDLSDMAATLTIDNPFAVLPMSPLWEVVTVDTVTIAVLLLLATAAVGMLIRYRRASGLIKLQMRWLVAALAAVVAGLIAGIAILAIAGDDADYAWIPVAVAYPSVPIAIGIAVLRYRLYEIDRLISRTIGWAVVTVVLVGAFVLLVLASTELLEPLTGGNTLAVAGSTLVVAALFAPLRARVQRAVDRRFDRARYDGERLVGAFGERLRDEVDLDVIRADILGTVDAAVRPSSVGLWLRQREGRGR